LNKNTSNPNQVATKLLVKRIIATSCINVAREKKRPKLQVKIPVNKHVKNGSTRVA